MTILQRAASFAALSLCVVGLSISTPGLANELDRTPINGVSIATAAIIPAVDNRSVPVASDLQNPQTSPSVPADAQDDEEYASLAAAVADQDMPDEATPELTCLAGAVYFESKGEPLDGQLAVAEVILNRVKSGRFGNSVCSVVTQRGQFSFVRGGRIPSVDASRGQYRTAMAIAQVAMNDEWDSKASNAMYFHARRVSPAWGKARVAMIGNHVFYR